MTNADAAVAEFLRDFWGSGTHLLSDDADIFDSFGIEGDDASEFIERFATQFKIDTSNYRWYFHHGEEGFVNVGAWLFKPPYRRVDRIPITPQVLAEAVRTKQWPLEYPAHKLASVRWDIRFNQALSFAMLALLLAVIWQRFGR